LWGGGGEGWGQIGECGRVGLRKGMEKGSNMNCRGGVWIAKKNRKKGANERGGNS
jgi:hypothetical protein